MTKNKKNSKKETASNRDKSRLLASVSHELRTPLNAILGFTEVIISENFGNLNATQKEYLHVVLENAGNLLELIEDILNVLETESVNLGLEKSEITIDKLLYESLSVVVKKARERKIRLVSDVCPITKTFSADEIKLKKILQNLLSHAVQNSPEGGEVRLQAKLSDCYIRSGLRSNDSKQNLFIIDPNEIELFPNVQRGKCVKFSVTDTGAAVKEDYLHQDFKPFQNRDISLIKNNDRFSREIRLYLTRRLVELHGGRIWMDKEGEGSTFSFVIAI